MDKHSASENDSNLADSTIDDFVATILEQHLQDIEAGKAVSREELLATHPEYAERLAECLDGLDLISAKSNEAPHHSEAPKTFADFELRGELGRGGMGVVYEAYQKSLDRVVALKVMRFGVVDPRALERFQREAETAGGLHHTNIVPVYATGREGDTSCCLLYTSPSPRDLSTSRMPSSA